METTRRKEEKASGAVLVAYRGEDKDKAKEPMLLLQSRTVLVLILNQSPRVLHYKHAEMLLLCLCIIIKRLLHVVHD
jgi:hypothetical protein